MTELLNIEEILKCPVCLKTNCRLYQLLPCSHKICSECGPKLENCWCCRSEIESVKIDFIAQEIYDLYNKPHSDTKPELELKRDESTIISQKVDIPKMNQYQLLNENNNENEITFRNDGLLHLFLRFFITLFLLFGTLFVVTIVVDIKYYGQKEHSCLIQNATFNENYLGCIWQVEVIGENIQSSILKNFDDMNDFKNAKDKYQINSIHPCFIIPDTSKADWKRKEKDPFPLNFNSIFGGSILFIFFVLIVYRIIYIFMKRRSQNQSNINSI